MRKWTVALIAALLLAGCGDDAEPGGATDAGLTDGAKKAPTLAEAEDAKGEVTMCAGKDTSGALTEAIKRFNKAHPGLTVKKFELASDATEVRNQFIQRAQAKSPECDVLQADIIWTAEFAQQNWIMDVSDYMADRKAEFIPSTLAPFDYDGKLWGVPQVTGAGLLYRRTDQVADVPASWQELYAQGAEHDGFAMQGAPYEGLTCNFIELSSAAGGRILSEDGEKAEFDSPENLQALQLMAEGMRNGGLVRATSTYMEETARQAFESGQATFMRNWSYAYALAKQAKKVKDVVDVSPLPPFEGGGKGGVLGGNGPVITAFTDNPEGALLWMDYWSSKETIDRNAAKYALPPTLLASYDEPSVQKAMPYSAELLNAVKEAVPRPVSPVYPQISEAIYKNVNAAMTGQQSPEDALEKGQDQIEKALASF